MSKKLLTACVAVLALAGCSSSETTAPDAQNTSTAATPSATAEPSTTAEPTVSPSVESTATPTASPTASPSATKSVKPTKAASATPQAKPRLAYDEIQVSGAWVKAMDTALPMDGTYMTAAFMSITNLSDTDITLLGGTATFAKEVQVHEVVNGKMHMKQGGLLIKAGTTEVLKAGANHLMFVFMPGKLMAGDEAAFTLSFAGNRIVKVKAPVKMTNAGSESYTPVSNGM